MQHQPIIIVNPTKFLGNLLISLGLIQRVCEQFERRGQSYILVFDETYKPLVQPLFKPDSLVFYPRAKIRQAGPLGKLALYFKTLIPLLKLKSAVAVDMEGDSVSSLLTLLSAAHDTIGPCGAPRSHWYKNVSSAKNNDKDSEFFKYRNVLAKLAEIPISGEHVEADEIAGISIESSHYGKLKVPLLSKELKLLLKERGIADYSKLVVLHTGASKVRKLWPTGHWVKLIRFLQSFGITPVLIGSGDNEDDINRAIIARLPQPIANLSSKLCLVSLSQVIANCRFFIGNDSGPMHLATSLGVPGIALFGPTSDNLWGPLLPNMIAIRAHQCPSSCRNGHACEQSFSCLTEISPDRVFSQFLAHVDEKKKAIVLKNKSSSQTNINPAINLAIKPSIDLPTSLSANLSANLPTSLPTNLAAKSCTNPLTQLPTQPTRDSATEFRPAPADDPMDNDHSIDHLALHSATP